MKSALGYLAAIIVIIGIGLGFTWFYLYQKGMKSPVSPVRHAFFDANPTEKRFLIAYQGATQDAPPNSMKALEAAAQLSPKLILWTDVQITADGTLISLHERSLHELGGPEALVSMSKDTDVLQLKLKKQGAADQPIALLKDVLAKFPVHRFVLNIREYRPGLDTKLADLIDGAKAGDRVLVQSEQDGFLRDMRALRPAWLFGTSQAQITQLHLLLPVGLQALAPIKGDVYLTPATRGEASLVNKKLVEEIHRRNRKVFAGPVSDSTLATQLLEMGVDGLVTPEPQAHLDLLQ